VPDLASEERPGRITEVGHEDHALIEALLA
jgi:hypothetical protein